ncbi:MAG: hypothetical protein ACFFAN_16420 [Promethearchaeota archaeon]
MNKKKIGLICIISIGWLIAGTILIMSVFETTSSINGSYEIHWSGTTKEQYKVNDSASGEFKLYNFFVKDKTLFFEYQTKDPDSLKIKLWINIENFDRPFVSKYNIKADYSSAKDDNADISIPGKINGSGHGSWDWQDNWKVKINKIILPKYFWGLTHNFILANFFYFIIGGSSVIHLSYKSRLD